MSRGVKEEAVAGFKFDGTVIESQPYGSGHINDTYLLKFKENESRVILQRMNTVSYTHLTLPTTERV